MSDLTKRAWDRRILHVDLRPALRTGVMPSQVVSVEAEPVSGGDSIVITDISLDGASVSFLASGGTMNGYYTLVIRFEVATMPGQRIEAITRLKVE